jgi:hypothetical protein
MTGAHGAWQLMAQLRAPLQKTVDVPTAVRRLAAQGLKPHNIAACLRVDVAAVEQALRQDVA